MAQLPLRARSDRLAIQFRESAMKRLGTLLLAAVAIGAAPAQNRGDWRTFSYDASGQRFSPLTQINTSNVSQLKLAWQYGVDRGGGGSKPAERPQPPGADRADGGAGNL